MEIGVLTFVGVVATAVLAALGTLIATQAKRITEVEVRIDEAEEYNDEMWEWGREQLDMYYRYRKDGAPNPKPIPNRKKTNN